MLATLGYAGWRVHDYFRTETVRIDDRLALILGGGGNTAVLVCDDGVLVVDTKLMRPGRGLADQIRTLTNKPVRTIVNTHYHLDHTHGNVNYPPGTNVMAHRRTRTHLVKLDRGFWEFGPAWELLPKDLVEDRADLRCGDETVRILHLGRGHTDGDVVVHLVGRGVILTGDLFLRNQYPSIDRRGGGSGVDWPETLDRLLAIPNVRDYVPGHGGVATRDDVIRFQSYLRSVVTQVREGVRRNESLPAIASGIDLQAFDDFNGIPFLRSPADNVRAVYEEITGVPPPGAKQRP
ncbi:MBL fold metallo-hydrolase [Candidatus Binatia bacterium]|nr:MBL fold metallo-hydrolase [Candidatus Binatia bacterium]